MIHNFLMTSKDFASDVHKFHGHYAFILKSYNFCVVVFLKKCFYKGLFYNKYLILFVRMWI